VAYFNRYCGALIPSSARSESSSIVGPNRNNIFAVGSLIQLDNSNIPTMTPILSIDSQIKIMYVTWALETTGCNSHA